MPGAGESSAILLERGGARADIGRKTAEFQSDHISSMTIYEKEWASVEQPVIHNLGEEVDAFTIIMLAFHQCGRRGLPRNAP